MEPVLRCLFGVNFRILKLLSRRLKSVRVQVFSVSLQGCIFLPAKELYKYRLFHKAWFIFIKLPALVGETGHWCYRELLFKELTAFKFRPTKRPRPLENKTKDTSWGLYYSLYQKRAQWSGFSQLWTNEQEIIDLPTIETNREREASRPRP